MDIQQMRQEYSAEPFDIEDVAEDPIEQFDRWFKEATDAELAEPNAMVLATVGEQGKPAARVLLLKGFDKDGFVFFTNYNSRKGKELTHTPCAAMVFNWLELQRQVRIEGKVVKISPDESTRYFQSRPKGSQIGAWASPQSEVIDNRSMLEDSVEQLEQQYRNEEALPRPEHWGGYLIKPSLVEFWQGRASRLHDRLQYTRKDGDSAWTIERLAP